MRERFREKNLRRWVCGKPIRLDTELHRDLEKRKRSRLDIVFWATHQFLSKGFARLDHAPGSNLSDIDMVWKANGHRGTPVSFSNPSGRVCHPQWPI